LEKTGMGICLRREERTPTVRLAVHSLKTRIRMGFFPNLSRQKPFLRRLIMNHHQKHLSACLIALAALLSTAPMAWAATPSLGTASTYAALAGGPAAGAVTCTDSTITGDVGVVPIGTFVHTRCTVNGTVNTNAATAYADFLTAYGQYPIGCTGSLDTAYTGATLTLTPGVYCNTAGVTFTDTTLTLDGTGYTNPVWIFEIGTAGSGALTGTNFTVMVQPGQACNVTWWVADAVTMTTSSPQGIILAGADITATGPLAGTLFNGDALAGGAGLTSAPTGAVTLTDFAITSCGATSGGKGKGNGKSQSKCNQGVGNGSENCDPGHSDKNQSAEFPWGPKSNDENGGTPGNPGRKGGNK
jgi:hypothetical protein